MNLAPIQGKKAKYLIVGGGAAGFSAIQAIKENDPDAQVILSFLFDSYWISGLFCIDCFN